MRIEILQYFDFTFASRHFLCEISAPFENCTIHMLSAAFYIKYICYLKNLWSLGSEKVLLFPAVVGVCELVCIYPFDDAIIPHDEWSGLFQSVSVNLEITYTMYMFKKVKQNSVEMPEFSISNFHVTNFSI